jgi:predicted RNase H-like HicB family nuclease
MADGATQSDALANAQKVIDEWIVTAKELGREIPKAKGKLMYA